MSQHQRGEGQWLFRSRLFFILVVINKTKEGYTAKRKKNACINETPTKTWQRANSHVKKWPSEFRKVIPFLRRIMFENKKKKRLLNESYFLRRLWMLAYLFILLCSLGVKLVTDVGLGTYTTNLGELKCVSFSWGTYDLLKNKEKEEEEQQCVISVNFILSDCSPGSWDNWIERQNALCCKSCLYVKAHNDTKCKIKDRTQHSASLKRKHFIPRYMTSSAPQ